MLRRIGPERRAVCGHGPGHVLLVIQKIAELFLRRGIAGFDRRVFFKRADGVGRAAVFHRNVEQGLEYVGVLGHKHCQLFENRR